MPKNKYSSLASFLCEISKKIPPKKENSISKVYELRNIDAENIAKILENIIEKNSYEDGEKPNISFSQETNSIVLTGQKDILEPLFNLLKDLDKQKELLRTAVINNRKNVYPRGEEPKANAAEELKKFYEY